MPKSVYIHIPFCRHICPYCDFNKFVVQGQPVMDYLQALQREMEITLEQYPPEYIQTIFVGGGTPTALNTEQMRFFLDSVCRSIGPHMTDLEFTMEVNPGSIDEEKLQVMREGGVNRLSFGVQSFDEQLLKQLGRIHNAEDVFRSLELAKDLGFHNISIDLMFGLPGQTVSLFSETLDVAFDLDLPHFSAYSLQVEEGTHFHRLYEKGKLPLPSEEEEFKMYAHVIERMKEQGYGQYEISNFAREGFESKHNLTYWKNEEYYGFGAGAHGYIYGMRHENAGPVQQYIELVQKQGTSFIDQHAVSGKEAMEEMMMMGLRLQQGVSVREFKQRFDLELENIYGTELSLLEEKGLLQKKEGRYSLTPKGVFLGNEVFMMFLN